MPYIDPARSQIGELDQARWRQGLEASMVLCSSAAQYVPAMCCMFGTAELGWLAGWEGSYLPGWCGVCGGRIADSKISLAAPRLPPRDPPPHLSVPSLGQGLRNGWPTVEQFSSRVARSQT